MPKDVIFIFCHLLSCMLFESTCDARYEAASSNALKHLRTLNAVFLHRLLVILTQKYPCHLYLSLDYYFILHVIFLIPVQSVFVLMSTTLALNKYDKVRVLNRAR